MNTDQLNTAIEQAKDIGVDHGKAAASWGFDGNTPDDAYRAVLTELDAGDPAVENRFNEPSFSSGDYSERNLFDDLSLDYDRSSTHEIDQIADAYLQSARDTFWYEIERMAREHLA